jgi:hypothetical protein
MYKKAEIEKQHYRKKKSFVAATYKAIMVVNGRFYL